MRPSKFESQDESSRRVLREAHSPKAFFSNGLIDRFNLMLVLFRAYWNPIVSSGVVRYLATTNRFASPGLSFFCYDHRQKQLRVREAVKQNGHI
jgi:hypothetical protein